MVAKLRTGITKAVQSVPAVATRSMPLIFDARRAFRRFTFFVKILPEPFYDLRVVQTQAIIFLKSMSERVGSDIQGLLN